MGFLQNKNREGSHDRRPDAETVRNHLPRTVYKILQRTTTCRNCIRQHLTDEPRPPPRQRPGPHPRPLSPSSAAPIRPPIRPPIRQPEDRALRRPINPTTTRHRPAIAAAADKAPRSFYHAPMNSSRLSAHTPEQPARPRPGPAGTGRMQRLPAASQRGGQRSPRHGQGRPGFPGATQPHQAGQPGYRQQPLPRQPCNPGAGHRRCPAQRRHQHRRRS